MFAVKFSFRHFYRILQCSRIINSCLPNIRDRISLCEQQMTKCINQSIAGLIPLFLGLLIIWYMSDYRITGQRWVTRNT